MQGRDDPVGEPGCLGVRVHSPRPPKALPSLQLPTSCFSISSFRFTGEETGFDWRCLPQTRKYREAVGIHGREGPVTQNGESLWQPFQEAFNEFGNKSMSGEGEFQ